VTGPLALLMAISGGFFGTAVALTTFYFLVRAVIIRALENWLKGAHERNECPMCKRPMQHEKP
jgi:hypothetical protein